MFWDLELQEEDVGRAVSALRSAGERSVPSGLYVVVFYIFMQPSVFQYYLFLKKIILFYLKSIFYREEKVFHSLVHCPHGHNSCN